MKTRTLVQARPEGRDKPFSDTGFLRYLWTNTTEEISSSNVLCFEQNLPRLAFTAKMSKRNLIHIYLRFLKANSGTVPL